MALNQFVVPQFIEVEDKVIGPITIRQFIIILVAGLIIFIAFRFADLALFIVITCVVGLSAITLAFVKINGQAFHYFLLNLIQTVKSPSRRLWSKFLEKKDLEKFRKQANKVDVITEEVKRMPRMSYSRIRDLSLTVNTGGYYQQDT